LLLVFTHKITPRLTYIFKHIFLRILNVPVDFTTKIETFVAHKGPKITYTKAPLGKEFFVRNNSLLFEQGVGDPNIEVELWENIPCFFKTGEKSGIPFDIFAASFYLMTRYEEYQPHVADAYGRFDAKQSLAYKHNFLNQPVIDIWAYKLLDKLKEKYPDYHFEPRQYKRLSIININKAFAYKHKGIIRNIGGFFSDLAQMNFRSIARRFLVLTGFRKDPFDTFENIISLKKKHNIHTVFFFLYSEYTTFDTNISFSNRKYGLLIKSIIDYTGFGQLFSHYTMKKGEKLIKEKRRFEDLVNQPVTKSRQHNNRLDLPQTYQNLVDNHITEDYSMGYNAHPGFRASTCTPFYFFDLDYEIQTPLKLFPFAVVDETLLIQNKLTTKEAFLKIKTIENEVKKVKGHFISVFHNTTFSDLQSHKKWGELYENVFSKQ